MTLAQRVGLAVLDEAFLAVLANGLEEPVAGVETAALGDHQRSSHEIGQQPQHCPGIDRSTGTDRFGRFARAPSSEHGQTTQEPLLGLVEQVV